MAIHAMFANPADVKRNFIRCKMPYYAVVDGKGEMIWINDEEGEIEDAAQMLHDDLRTIREYNTAIYTIRHFAKVPTNGIKKTSEPDCISTYKQQGESYSPEAKEQYKAERYSFQNELVQTLKSMQVEMQDIKMKLAMDDSPDEPELLEQVTGSSIVGKVLENPQVLNLLTNICANLFTNGLPSNQPKALAGVPASDVETVENILDRLISKGVTIQDMQKLSNMEVSQINMLLNILRAQ